MLTAYRRKANVAGAFWLLCLVVLVASVSNASAGSIWDDGNYAAQFTMLLAVSAWFYSLWAYLKAKGQSAWWALAGVLAVVGLAIVLLLPDRNASVALDSTRGRTS